MRRFRRCSFPFGLILAAFSSAPFAATFTPLGDLPGGAFYSVAAGVSDDGLVVVGRAVGASGSEAFRWTSSGGMVGLGYLAGTTSWSEATGVSSDGSVVAGYVGTGGSTIQAFRWTISAGMSGLGAPSAASAVSADGTVIVGSQDLTVDGLREAFRWTASTGRVGLGDLGTPPGDVFQSGATGLSGDGSVVVGNATPGATSGQYQAFRWTSTGGMVGLPLLPGHSSARANAVSRDGLVVVGISDDGAAWRWTSGTGTVNLGLIGPAYTLASAIAISADGGVIGGLNSNEFTGEDEAFIWTQAGGMQRLFDVLVAAGTTGLAGWNLKSVTGISADGTKLVGFGRNASGQNEAFLVNLAVVPLPAGVWLLASALGGLVVLRRQRD